MHMGMKQQSLVQGVQYAEEADLRSEVAWIGNAPVLLQHLDVEEAQCPKALDHGVRTELQLAEQHRLVLPDVLGTKIGTAMEVLAEVFDSVDVRTNR